MKTIRFKSSPMYGGAYGCSEPGDQSGEFVPAEVARRLAEAVDGLLEIADKTAFGAATVIAEARSAMAIAGPSGEPTHIEPARFGWNRAGYQARKAAREWSEHTEASDAPSPAPQAGDGPDAAAVGTGGVEGGRDGEEG